MKALPSFLVSAAAADATKKVEGLLEDDQSEIAQALQKMREEAEETERRCTEVAGEREGKKTAILDKAAETKKEGQSKKTGETEKGERRQKRTGKVRNRKKQENHKRRKHKHPPQKNHMQPDASTKR